MQLLIQNLDIGYWKLKYLSREGVGKIDLHLQGH